MTFCNSKGQALVEVAISLLLLLLIVFGTAEFGRAMYVANTLNYAAREGARRASVSPRMPGTGTLDTAALEAQIRSCIPFDQSGLTISILPATPAANDTIRVTVSLPFTPMVGLMEPFFTAPLRGEAAMRYENT